MGLEKTGEIISDIGQGIIFIGGAITVIGMLIPVVAKIAEKAGMKVSAAWGWLALIVAGIAVLLTAVILIFA
jgi:hypothetical protein